MYTTESNYPEVLSSLGSGIEAPQTDSAVGERLYSGDAQQSEARDIPIREPYGIDVGGSSSLREVNISPLSSGYMVRVGCQSIAVEDTATLIAALTIYLEDPTEFEKRWYSKPNRNRLKNIL